MAASDQRRERKMVVNPIKDYFDWLETSLQDGRYWTPRDRDSQLVGFVGGGGLNGTLKKVFENSIFPLHLCQPSTSPFLSSLSLHLSSGATLLPGSHHWIDEKCLLGSATRYRERVLLHDYDVMFSCHRRCTIQSSIVKLLDTRAFVC